MTRSEESTAAAAAERRQLTVLFCDLVDSTALSRRLDAEDYRDLVLAYQNAAAQVIERYEGHIAQYLGDGLLVYFGHPAAQENDAERAVRAGYDILRALTRLNHQPPLQARIGIHTGSVVVGQMGGGGRTETLAMGDTTNIAARLQSIAEPNTVVISPATLKLVPGLFITKDLGAQQLKGIDESLPVYQIIQPSGVRTRLEATEHLTPFVGRTQELALLSDRWQQASEGQGQAVLLSAEPGLGKSRLLLTLREQIKGSAHSWLECRCMPMTRNSAFAPVIELLTSGLQLKETDSDAIKLQRLEEALDRIGQDKQETVPLLAPLLNLNLPEQYPPSPYGPELKRKKILALLTGWILALAKQQPLLLAFEDLHWADLSSLDLMNLLIEQLPAHNVMVLFTARPEFQPAWPNRQHIANLTLRPLHTEDTGQMLNSLTQHKPLPPPVQEKILQRAGGVPLFLEEITKALVESGQLQEQGGRLELAGKLQDLFIPATLQDSLTARIDRLGESKPLIQLCAVIGREISYKLLTHVADSDEPSLQQNLKTLTDAQLFYARGSSPDFSYLFKHALIQDTAYNSLLKSTRQKLHGRIAAALEQHFKERTKAEPAVLAEHFEKAGQLEQAVKYYKVASEAAAARSVVDDAISFCKKALDLVPSLPEGVQSKQLELALLARLAPWLSIAKSYAHPDVRSTLERARSLVTTASDPMAQALVLTLSNVSDHVAGQYETAAEFGEQMTNLGRSTRMPLVERSGLANAAWSYNQLGRFGDALASTDKALQLATDFEAELAWAKITGVNSRVTALMFRSWTLWAIGYPDNSLALAQQAITRAEALGVPTVSCLAASLGMPLALRLRRQADALLEACTSAAALCDRYGYHDLRILTSANMGIALGMLGRLDEGLAMLRQAMKARDNTGTVAGPVWDYADMARICLEVGRLDEVRAALDCAFELMEKRNERSWQAELHRLKGELVLAEAASPLSRRGEGAPTPSSGPSGHPSTSSGRALLPKGEGIEEAEACFHKALEVSRSQQAKSFELRAATSLARLWQNQNHSAEARDLLKPVYDWFTEGLDTPDLKDAKALLDQLDH